MKILIADDEELVRIGLRDILRGNAQDDEVYEAVNGRTLIETARELKPDICFVDIRMPGINGLEAIEELSKDFPEISWIILSGYSDFDYARKALSLGVLDYLLKPVTEAEVEAALIKAASKRIEVGKLKREKFEYRVGGVLNNASAVEFDTYLLDMEHWSALVSIPERIDEGELFNQQHELFMVLKNSLDNNPPEDFAGLFTILDGYPAIIAGGKNPESLLKKLEADVIDQLDDSSRRVFSPSKNSLSELLEFFEASPVFKDQSGIELIEDNNDRSARIVRQAEKLVREQYNNPIGVAQIAEQLNVTPNYLSSLFKKYKRISFTRFITDIRLNEAPKLLETPGITVKEAASRLGYMSSRHFARLFREKYGMSPSDYYRK